MENVNEEKLSVDEEIERKVRIDVLEHQIAILEAEKRGFQKAVNITNGLFTDFLKKIDTVTN